MNQDRERTFQSLPTERYRNPDLNPYLKLHEQFGTMSALQDALRQKKFPKIELDGRNSRGKARRTKLATYLL